MVCKRVCCDIKDYPDYVLYRDGHVFSKKTKTFIKPQVDKGYLRVKLFNEDGPKKILLHRLVADHFCKNPYKGEPNAVVNHKNNNTLDPNADNLEWLLQKDNVRYIFEQNRKEKTPVIQLDKNLEVLNRYDYIADAVQETGVAKASIIRCCKSKQKTAGGFVWKYDNNKQKEGIVC